MYLKTQGLVLRVSRYNDHDALLSLLTAEHGKITVKARGLNRKNSPLITPCQLLALGNYTLFEYKGSYTVNEAVCLEQFRGLRSDIVKLSLGSYFAQVAEQVSQSDIPNRELLSLVLNSLYGLSELGLPENKVKSVFEFRCACMAGYMPDLSGCHMCGGEKPDRFDVSAGVLECHGCRDASSAGLRMPITPGVLDAMRYISFCEAKEIFRFELPEDTLEKLSQITETYLITQLERGFSTLDFYKSLLLPL